jgi:cytochrome c-type biogenesis protein CcmH
MPLFWMFAVSLIVLSLLFVFVPLWRTRTASGVSTGRTADTGVSIYQSQLAELDADRQNGVISEAQYNAARLDLQRGLLEMSGNENVRAAARSWRWPAGIGALVAVPALTILIYQGFGGGPMAWDPPGQGGQQVAARDTPADMDIDMVIAALHERLEQSPDDPVGWALLGRVYKSIGQNRAAVEAYAASLEHGGNHDADILIDYADLLGTLSDGSLEGRPRDLIRRALEIEPNHVTGLWLAGTADFRAGDYAAARTHWQRLARLLPAQSETGAIIRANLAEVDARIAAQQ